MRVTPESLARGMRAEWRLAPLKYQVERLNEKSDGGDAVDSPYVGLENIGSWTGTYIPGESEAGEGMASTFGAGDVLFGKLRPYLAKVWLAGFAGRCTSEALVLRGRSITPRFLKYLLLAHPFVNLVGASTYGAKMPRAEWEFIGNINVPVPPDRAQCRIADFLDGKTAAIDELIRKKERLIELLQEKRQALITEAVTKGLDPAVPMKDSGVEWLAHIPSHWTVKRLKHISPRQTVGVVVNPSAYYADEGVPFLFGSNVREGAFLLDGVRRISDADNETLNKSKLQACDIVVVRVGYPGVAAVIPAELDGCNCASMMIVRQSQRFDSRWLCYAINSRIGRYQVELVQYGAAQEQFNISHAVEWRFPVPPLDEQRRTADQIDSSERRLGRARDAATSSIERLREYRQALIAAAVTGKLEVA